MNTSMFRARDKNAYENENRLEIWKYEFIIINLIKSLWIWALFQEYTLKNKCA